MSAYKFAELVPYDRRGLNPADCWLVIWNPDRKPPHVGISTQNAYFSLKYTGKDREIPIERLLSFASRKNKKILLVQVRLELGLERLVSVFEPFGHTIPGSVSCLRPILEALDRPREFTLPELLNALEKERLLGRVFQLNLNQFDGLLDYGPEDINKRLDELDAKRRNHFPAGA